MYCRFESLFPCVLSPHYRPLKYQILVLREYIEQQTEMIGFNKVYDHIGIKHYLRLILHTHLFYEAVLGSDLQRFSLHHTVCELSLQNCL